MANETSSASQAAARALLDKLEKQSPVLAMYMGEPLREIVISAMALCYIDGVIHGTEQASLTIDSRLASLAKTA